MAYPHNMVRIRNGTVTPITVPEDKLQYLKTILDSKILSTTVRKAATIKQVMGGSCCICREIPSMQVSYDVDGATQIERYCDSCIKSVYSREQVL